MARLEVYRSIAEHTAAYDRLYAECAHLHDFFGRSENAAMKQLKALKAESQRPSHAS